MKSNIIGTKLLDENIDMDEIMFMNKIHDKYMEIQWCNEIDHKNAIGMSN